VENIWTAFRTKTAPPALARQQSDPGSKQSTTDQGVSSGSQGTFNITKEVEVVKSI